ncbi:MULTISPECIES: serine/threonine-protein kinase [unclassified Streptomyces]|uniref:serine/threonine-protein kinase n=1 Tax=unclassified Streptomyces TaxID=2593676 RepID=UPI00081E272D|nr:MULTISPECIES: serine/threonine-protein kinase [unclassified Streptomyces]MYR92364.1 protein kinase [Streptomyces sp. SID4937]SCD32476.1 serine/threonine protein kinase [Streptomyces sp. ScaeMP-e83]
MTRLGKLVLHRFELLEQVGSGGQGQLFAGRDIESGRKVAVKLQRPRMFESEGQYEEMGEEIRAEGAHTQALGGIRGIPRFIASGSYGRQRCIVLEFVDGAVLYDAMIKARPLKVPTAAAIIGQLCEILDLVHKRPLVHRDVKPENIILEPDGRVRLIDMGLAIAPGVPTERGSGTFGYAPPEQWQANPDGVTPQSDVFALGCMLLEMTVMQLPYAGMTERPEPDCPVLPADRLQLVPAEIRSLTLRMVERAPMDRPANVHEVFRELLPFLPSPGTKPPAKPLTPDPTEYYRT